MPAEAQDRRLPRDEPPARQRSPLLLPGTVALVALAVPLFFFGLGSVGLFDPDEPYYALPAREMLESGAWGITTLHGRPWFDKPILFYWMVAGAYRAMGISETAARIGSAMAALAGVLAVFWVGMRGRLGDRGAFVAAIALAANLEYAYLARAAVTDMTLALFVTLGMLAVERYLARGRLPLAGLAGAAFGLAALTKGPVGFLLPGTALALYAALARRPDLFRPRALLAGLAGASLTAAPWYAYVFLTHRELLTGAFLGQGNVWRFLNPEHRSFPLYYAFVLVAGLLPWSGALPAAIAEAARPSGWARERGRGREAGPLFALCWFVAVVAVFEITASKLPTYVLPAFAPAATLIGGYWDRALGAGGLSRPSWHARLSAALGVVAALLAGAMIVGSLHERDWVDARGSGAGFAALLIVVAVVGLAAVLRGSLPALVASQAAGAALAMLVVVAWALPRLEETRSARPMVLDLERRGVAAELAGMAAVEDWYGFDFYLGRPLPRISAADLPRAVLEHPGRIWLVHTDQRDRLLAGAGLSATAVISGPLLTALRLEPAAPRDGGER